MNTLKIAKVFEKHNYTESEVELIVEALEQKSNLATKEDLQVVKEELTRDIQSVKEELTKDIQSVKEELTKDIQSVKEKVSLLQGSASTLIKFMWIVVGLLGSVVVTVLLAVIKYLFFS